jgi:hypothetical protein
VNASEQVRIVLTESKRKGTPFEQAWYSALRSLVPPTDCAESVRAEHDELKAIFRESKAYWRSAYEGRSPTQAELEDGMRHAHRRLRDLLLSEEETAAERAARPG